MGNSTHATALREDEPQAKSERQSATAKGEKLIRAYKTAHQFPMGKAKESDVMILVDHVAYQFPMGKVKPRRRKK